MQIVSTPPPPGQSIARQRVNKSGSWASSANTDVPSWASDATYPGTPGAGLVVVGSGTANITCALAATTTKATTVTAYKNGVSLGTLSSSGTNRWQSTFSGISVVNGDLISIRVTTSNVAVQAANTWIELVPA